ncbi:LysR substrate-binding domain-containing protein [Pseudoroseomonas cervicalis]|uniref:LysR substrate-binding domain-containing protein n=1 Tax=Teichococcus cervicalis TaxID=204525 RepID=UPI002780B715|nr:LysR substrate-binding domain-containing protein [Pseudoroseomonas cervicalis]MDQ1081602.1 DNA-binding transcriptional LysR family regulator [Pseudoroseomonas cervicalis]
MRIHTQRLGYDTVLKPFLPGFLAAHPRITVEVEIGDAGLDIVSGRFDLAIRLGELLEQDVIAIPLQPPMRQIAVASPAYLAAQGAPLHPRDLLRHRCLCFRWPGHDALYSWEFFEDGAWFAVPVSGPLIVNDQRATIDAAIAGAGIAFWVESELQPHIGAGRLVPLLLPYTAEFPGFALSYARHRHRSAAVNACIAALRASARR